jgi:beta-aspartyl-peptidase (threonine type)
MLYGNGAEEFARENGYEMTDTSYFFTQENYDRLQRIIHQNKTAFSETPENNNYKYGTVGCVALDKHGNIAAGTSTGGMTNKRWNRIGDSPIIGAGTYANNLTCGVSATGWGEKFIRSVAAYDISALMEYKGLSLQEAAHEVIHNKLPKMQGDGGIIAIDKYGNIVMEFNTPGMYRAAMNDKGELTVGLFENEE